MRLSLLKRFFTVVLPGICCLLPMLSAAQTTGKKVQGSVLDSGRLPLSGVSVTVVGTTTGTTTDAAGHFTIIAPAEGRLGFSIIGYKPKMVPVAGINGAIVLEADPRMLEDLVVIGYGAVKKKDLTGAIQSISGATLEKAMTPDVTQALNGRVSGVNVFKSSNRPGAGMSVQIRGTNSFNFSNEPLYVINGVPSTNGMRHLNADDIESIDVLKDASSSAIYGSRGANGVVIITTKGAGKRDGVEVNYNGYTGIKNAARVPDMIGAMGNGLDYVDYRVALWTNKYGPSSLSRPDFLTDKEKERIRYGEYYDWAREILHTGTINNHNLSASGGTEKTSYSFGVGYFNEEGIIGKENFNRLTANIGLEQRFNKYIKTGFNAYLAKVKINEGAAEALINAYFLPPIVSPFDDNGNLLFKVQPTSSKVNPIIDMQNDIRERNEMHVNAAAFLEIAPVEWITFKTQIATQYDNYVLGNYKGTFTQAKAGVNTPEASKNTGADLNYVWDNILTIKKTLATDHKIHFIGLFSAQKDTHESAGMTGEGLPYNSLWHAIQTADQIRNVTSGYWESSMLSLMGRVNYTYKDRYLFTVTTRYDGSSRLAPGNRWGLMPSTAIGWQIKEEEFMKSVKAVSDLKLRVSYGKTGNNNVRNDVTMTRLAMSKYNFGDAGAIGFGRGNEIGNPNLKWEMTSEVNLGLDFGFLHNRIKGSLDIYDRTTKDLIFERKVANINGYSSYLENVGSTGNKGIELGLSTINIAHKNFSWKTDLTFSRNKNRIIDLYGDKNDDVANRWFIGQPMRVIYDYNFQGIWQQDEKDAAAKYGKAPGHIKVEDVNGDGAFDERDMKVIGSPNPDWTGGITNSFTYKAFDLSFFVYARVGGLYNDPFTYMFTAWDNEHWNKLDVKYWTPENKSNEYPAIGAVSLHTQVLGNIRGTFVKLQNATFGYTVPAHLTQRWKIKHLRVYTNVQNLLTLTKYLGSDPESIGEDPYSNLSIMPRTYTLGLNLTL